MIELIKEEDKCVCSDMGDQMTLFLLVNFLPSHWFLFTENWIFEIYKKFEF